MLEDAAELPGGCMVLWSSLKCLLEPNPRALFGFFCPPPAQMSLSPCYGDERTGDRIMRWLVFADDEQALVSKCFNVRTDSALISSSNDHFTVYCCSNCMFCSLRGSGAAEWNTSPSFSPFQEVSRYRSLTSCLFSSSRLSHLSQFEDAAYLWSPFCRNEAWQIRSFPKSCRLNGTDESGWKPQYCPCS